MAHLERDRPSRARPESRIGPDTRHRAGDREAWTFGNSDSKSFIDEYLPSLRKKKKSYLYTLYTYIENSYIDRTITEYTSGPWPGLRRGPGPRHAARRESVPTDHSYRLQLHSCVVAFTNSVNSSSPSAPRISACHSMCPATLGQRRAGVHPNSNKTHVHPGRIVSSHVARLEV